MKYLLTCALLIQLHTISHAQIRDLTQLQSIVKTGIAKAYAASVRIWGFDTVRRMQNSSQFSGVVVSDEGHILTVSHAIQPNRTYKVLFPDGREVMAVALGKIGFRDMQSRPDLGMMRIISKGAWPVAEMGWSYSAKENEPCISIAYPETLNQLQPTVRYGKITHILDQWGFMQSTCKMEPGDSGGPLFDYLGRVIGMHSRVVDSEDENYEVPVDLYRKYWTALNIPENYKELPQDTDIVQTDPLAETLAVVSTLPAPSVPSCVYTIHSQLNDISQISQGTAFHLNGKTLIVCKGSLISEKVTVEKQTAIVIARDTANDLALLSVRHRLPGALPVTALNDTIALSREDLGTFLISPLKTGNRVSIVGSTFFLLPGKSTSTKRPDQGHAANRFAGGKSIRRDGFSAVFSHDPVLQPSECGGPVFDCQGRFYGINIARFSRTSTLVMPVKQIRALIATQIKIS
jgi:serine protease Do